MDFLNQEPTVSDNNSRAIYVELLTTKTDWILYSKNTIDDYDELVKLINRYINSHSSVPGVVTEEILSSTPIDIFYFEDVPGGFSIKGALYSNGAVVHVKMIGREHTMLLVHEKIAKAWGYPDSYIHTTEYFRGSTQRE